MLNSATYIPGTPATVPSTRKIEMTGSVKKTTPAAKSRICRWRRVVLSVFIAMRRGWAKGSGSAYAVGSSSASAFAISKHTPGMLGSSSE